MEGLLIDLIDWKVHKTSIHDSLFFFFSCFGGRRLIGQLSRTESFSNEEIPVPRGAVEQPLPMGYMSLGLQCEAR